jgi:hypothetical protein
MMKLKRRAQPEFDPAFAELTAAVYVAFEDNCERCSRLTALRDAGVGAAELRPEALEAARNIAYLARVWWAALTDLNLRESRRDGALPIAALSALARLAYALVAIAEEDSEPEALLSKAEIDGLAAQYRIEDWAQSMAQLRAAARAGAQ